MNQSYIATIIRPAHLAHSSCNDVAFLEFTAGSVLDEAGGFDAEDARELDVGAVALTGEHFASVEAGGFDADEDLAGYWGWNWTLGGSQQCGL